MCSCHGQIVFHEACGTRKLELVAKKTIRNTSGTQKRGVEDRVRQNHFSKLHEIGARTAHFGNLQATIKGWSF